MTSDRPAGLNGLVVLCVALALIALTCAGLILRGVVPLSSGAWLLGGGLEQLGPLAFALYAAGLAILALGLWKRWGSARRVTILVAVAGIALAVPAISSAVVDSRLFAIAREGLQIIARVLVVFYLSQEPVKDWFAGQ
jgi:hypothetical protein